MGRIVRSRRGATLLLALMASGIGLLLGLTFLSRSTTVVDAALVANRHAQARQISDAGLQLAIASVSDQGDWRSGRAPGRWLSDYELFGGRVSVEADFEPATDITDASPEDASFELEARELPTPPINPPMAGVIGGWNVSRTALLETGLTVPRIGTRADGSAPDGANVAFMTFTTAVDGSATLRQQLSMQFEPFTAYQLRVDVDPNGIPLLDSILTMRVMADTAVVASSDHAFTLQLPAIPPNLPQAPSSPVSPPEVEALFQYLDTGGGVFEATLQFSTGDSPPAGDVVIEFYAESLGLSNEIELDNVRFGIVEYEPLTLTSIGEYEGANHKITAMLIAVPTGAGTSTTSILVWKEN